jgi:hypothetical protein
LITISFLTLWSYRPLWVVSILLRADEVMQ